MRLAPLLFATSSLLLVGCPDDPPVEIRGDEGNVSLVSFKIQQGEDEVWAGPHVAADHTAQYVGDGPLLAGTEACLTWGAGEHGGWGPSCHALQVTTPSETLAPDAPDCFVFEEGSTRFDFTPTPDPPCEASGEITLIEDSIEVRAIAADAVDARFVPWPEQWVPTLEGAETVGAVPDDFLAPYGPTLRLAAGGEAKLQVALFEGDSLVGWNDRAGVLALEEADRMEGSAGDQENQLIVTARGGGSARATLTLGESTWTVAELSTVPVADIATVDIGAIVIEGGAYARAFARDADGELVHGAPVRWSVDETSLAWSGGVYDSFLAGDDYASLGDTCVPPSKRPATRTVTLNARVGDASDALELTWVNPEGDDADWTKPASCRPAGCAGTGCATGGAAPTGLSLLLVLLIRSRLVTRRRERRC